MGGVELYLADQNGRLGPACGEPEQTKRASRPDNHRDYRRHDEEQLATHICPACP